MESLSLTSPLHAEPVFHLPEWRTPIIGRYSESREIASLLLRDDTWLVTITGPGGVGKSRLAHDVASRLMPEFDGDVAWIPLAPALEIERAIETVAHNLGINAPGLPPEQAITHALSDQRALLVLDSLEQIPDIAAFISRLSEANPQLAFLATSRVPLRLRGEREFALAPFAVPEGIDRSTAERLTSVPAVELFVSRAQAAESTFALTDRNAPAVAEICRRLDGLPLAIELAAARVRLLPPEAMVPRLARSLDLLTTGPRDAHPRQQTLRNTIQWSYDLLPAATQVLFRRLAVFSDGFGLDAAQAVAGSEHDALEHLSALLDHSLLVRLDDEDLRFAMLDTIREFASDALGTGDEMSESHDRHARYFHALIDTDMERPAQVVAWLDLVDREIGNVRDALAWLESTGQGELLKRLCNLANHSWLTRGSVSEGNDWLRRADRIPGDLPASEQIQFDLNLAWTAAQVGDFETAKAVLSRISLDELRSQRFKLRTTYQMAQGALAFYERDLDTAFDYIDGARKLAEEDGVIASNPSIRINLGAIAWARGDFGESRTQHRRGLDDATEPGVRAMHSGALAELEVKEGNLEAAWEHLQSTWRLARELGHMLIMISAMATMVELLLRVGKPEVATRLMGAADQLRLLRGWSISTYSEPEYFGLIEACKAQLTLGEYEASVAAGQAMSQADIDVIMDTDPFAVSSEAGAPQSGGKWRLTSRETDVLLHLVEGKTNPEIAAELFISERTVQTHVARILQKLNVPSRSAAAVFAVREGIL